MVRSRNSSIYLLLFVLSLGCTQAVDKGPGEIEVEPQDVGQNLNSDSVEVIDTIRINEDFFFLRYMENDSLVMCHDFVKGGLDHSVKIEVKDSILIIDIHGEIIEERFTHCSIQDYYGYAIAPVEGNCYLISSGILQVFNDFGKFELNSNIWVKKEGSAIDTMTCGEIKVSEDHFVFGSNFVTVYKVVETGVEWAFLRSSYIQLRKEDQNTKFPIYIEDATLTYQEREETTSTSDFEYEGFVLLN